jgi:hypothetical protein
VKVGSTVTYNGKSCKVVALSANHIILDDDGTERRITLKAFYKEHPDLAPAGMRESLFDQLEDIREAGRVISSANMSVLQKIRDLASGAMHGFPGASKIVAMCEDLMASGAPADGAQMQEAIAVLDYEQMLQEASRTFTADQRKEYADKGIAMADGSYPIPDKDALGRAISSIGRGDASYSLIKRHIIKRARALGAVSMLPEDWNIKESQQPYEPSSDELLALADVFQEAGIDVELTEAPGATGNISHIIKAYGSWAGDKQHLCVSMLKGKEGISDPNALCAWLKDRYTGTTTWRGTERKKESLQRMVEAGDENSDSYEELMSEVRASACQQFGTMSMGGGQPWVNLVATYPDRIIFRKDYDGELYGADYTFNDSDTIVWSAPYEVRVDYIKEALHSDRLIEAVEGSEGREWDVILIAAGQSGNGTYYDSKVLKEAVPLFSGVSAFADHVTDAEMRSRPERSIRDKVGKFSSPEYGSWDVGGQLVEGIKARFKVVAPWLREILLEAHRASEPDFLGFSIDAVGRTVPKTVNGRKVRWVESISKVTSVDVVTTPAAGGRTVRLVASQAPDSGRRIENMDPEELQRIIRESLAANQTSQDERIQATVTAAVQEAVTQAVTQTTTALQEANKPLLDELAALREANNITERARRVDDKLKGLRLSDLGRSRLREALLDTMARREVNDEEMDAAIKSQVDYEAALAGNGARAMAVRESARIVASEADKYDLAIQGMFANEDLKDESGARIPRFHGLKEAFCRWTGADAWNFDESGPFAINRAMMTRYDSALDHTRIRESLSTASWGEIYADNLYVRMMKQYQASPMYDQWRKFVSDLEDVPDFQTRHWARIGGYGDLATVAEGANYGSLTTPTDEEITYAIAKRGGLDDVTFEAITNDRFNAIRRIPDAMGRAAARTLFKFVMNMITTDNPTMDYDAVTLYNAAHGNTGVTPLSLSGVASVRQAMRDQTAYNETLEILGSRNVPKHIIVPNELEFLAQRITNPSDAFVLNATADTGTNIDPQAFKGAGMVVTVYDQLTDANDWWVVADPAESSTVVMGFLNGQQQPEMFVADDPKVGSQFTADKTVYKVRHIFGGDVLDHRSFYREVVP